MNALKQLSIVNYNLVLNFNFLIMNQESLSQCLNETEMPLELKELIDAIEELPAEHKTRL